MPDDLAVTGAEAAQLADALLRAGRPFHAHEVLEAAWKNGPGGERDLWQGLAQIAVGLTHAHRGNARGAVTLLRRGARRVRAWSAAAEAVSAEGETHAFGMNVGAVVTAAEGLATRIERNGLASVPAADLTPGLLS
jgi:uncharacterized protein